MIYVRAYGKQCQLKDLYIFFLGNIQEVWCYGLEKGANSLVSGPDQLATIHIGVLWAAMVMEIKSFRNGAQFWTMWPMYIEALDFVPKMWTWRYRRPRLDWARYSKDTYPIFSILTYQYVYIWSYVMLKCMYNICISIQAMDFDEE